MATQVLSATSAHNLSHSARTEAAGLQISPDTLLNTTATSSIPSGDTTVTLTYFAPPEDGAAPFFYVEDPPEGQPKANFGSTDVDVPIHDIRGQESQYTLDKDAFQVISHLPPSQEREFTDDSSIKQNFYPEVEQLILEHIPGSNRVFIFDHTIRRSTPNAHRGPVTRVHIDQTPKSAEDRVRLHLGAEADALLQRRYRIVNVWRPINGVVEATPLAFASSDSFDDADLIPVQHRYPDRTGETAGIKHNPAQRWNYLSAMQDSERLLLECFDSEGLPEKRAASGVQGGRVPHTAFVDKRTPEGAKGRESIEVRALVFGP